MKFRISPSIIGKTMIGTTGRRSFYTRLKTWIGNLIMIAIVVVGVAGIFLAPSSARAALPISLPNQNAQDAQVVIDSTGDATAIWRRFDGSNWIIQSATRRQGGEWSDPADLSQLGGDASNPELSVAVDNSVTAVWQRTNGANSVIQTLTKTAEGVFPSPSAGVSLSPENGNAAEPQVGASTDGSTTVVWVRFLPFGRSEIRAATRQENGQFPTPNATQTLSSSDHSSVMPQIASAPNGATTAIWSEIFDGDDIVMASTRPADGVFPSFGEAVALSAPGNNGFDAQIAAGPTGTTVVWTRYNGLNTIIQASTRPVGGIFPPPGQAANLSAQGQDAANPQVVADQDETTVVWSRSNGTNSIIQASTKLMNGTFPGPSQVLNLSGSDQSATTPQIASRNGTTTVVWSRSNGSNTVVQASSRSEGESFPATSEVEDLSAEGQDAEKPQVVVGPDGFATAIWQRFNGEHTIIEATSAVAPTDHQIDITRQGNGSGVVTSAPAGINCGGSCSQTFAHGTAIVLTAAASSGSQFTGWGGACEPHGTTATCTLTMDKPHAAFATFALDDNPPPPPPPPPPLPPLPDKKAAVFDGTNLYVKVLCPGRFKPRCISQAVPVTSKKMKSVNGKKLPAGKPMATVQSVKAASGKWKNISFLVKPTYRTKINNIAKAGTRTLNIRQKIRSKRLGKKKNKIARLIFHKYKVRTQ